MSEAGTRPASAAGFKGVLLVLGVSLGVIFITSFVYRLGNPSMVRELRRSAAPAPGEGGMEGMGGNRIRDLMAAMGENPDDPAIPLELGESFMIMQAWPRALVFLDRTLELDPKNVRAMRGKGMALFETKKPGEASEVFEAILKIEPNDPQVHYNLRASSSGIIWKNPRRAGPISNGFSKSAPTIPNSLSMPGANWKKAPNDHLYCLVDNTGDIIEK